MDAPKAWVQSRYALVHGEDGEGRRRAVEAWKAEHVDPEWEVFSFTVCAEGCPWAEVFNALQESAPLGSDRVVLVPQADNLLERAKELPAAIKALLTTPLDGTRLLLVARGALSAGPGRILGAKPFSDWAKQGRVLKLGELDEKEAPAWVEAEAQALGLRLASQAAGHLVARAGRHPGILRRCLEVLDLLADDRRVSLDLIDQATLQTGSPSAFAWSRACTSGQLVPALAALRQALEDEPADAPLLLLGQARREVDRLCRLADAQRQGVKAKNELVAAMGLPPNQAFLLDRCQAVLARIRPEGAADLLAKINQTDLDLKGHALSRSPTTLVNLTVSLCRAWAG